MEFVASVCEHSLFKVDANHCAFDFLVSKHFLDVEQVVGFMIFHCAFPVAEGGEGYFAILGLLSFLAAL